MMRSFSTCGLSMSNCYQEIVKQIEKKTKDLKIKEKKVKRAGYCSQDREARPRVVDHFGVKLSCMVVRPLIMVV